MTAVCLFIKYNGQWESVSRYIGGKMKGIMVPLTATYVGLLELVSSVIGLRGQEKTIVIKYAIDPKRPLMKIHSDADINFLHTTEEKGFICLANSQLASMNWMSQWQKAIPPEIGKATTYLCNLLELVDKVMKLCDL
ncbi:hypothetical protein TIFTF001_041165 [Ficus carica]|uniref:Uncharacterized protein n=1 Tax=Ficus carica TaxID=3494 RepID=A0AA87Z2S2_FICCA|nr:hypothetical protein TIFTF001_041165 [Ficus carica]